ncbi:MAG: hypothetical protein PHG00_16025 [Methylococcales bacterium]|nr:hypothetical protein [Methylococcales bacterium]
MISEINLLREDIPRLEKKFGVNHLFVKVLKAQLASLLKQTEQGPHRGRNHRGLINLKRLKNWKRNKSTGNSF